MKQLKMLSDEEKHNIAAYLSTQAAKPGANMVIPKLTEDQITALIAYLDTLK